MLVIKLMQGKAQNKANTIRQLICHPIAQLIAAKLVIFSVLAQTLYNLGGGSGKLWKIRKRFSTFSTRLALTLQSISKTDNHTHA